MFGLRTSFFQKTRHQVFQHRTNATCREGRWTGEGNHVLSRGYRVFLVGDRRTKCLDGDRQRTVWCLQQHQHCYLRNRRTKCVFTVSCRRPDKLGCRSNSPSFCAAQVTSHVSSELWTFRCLLGHVCQRCGPVSRNTVGTMVDVCQVMMVPTIICKIQVSRLTTLVRNESRCSCNCTEILALLTMKLELPSPLLSDSPFLSSEQFFCFSSFSNVPGIWTQNRDPRFDVNFPRPCTHKFSITAITVIEIFLLQKSEEKEVKTKIETRLVIPETQTNQFPINVVSFVWN